jgi:hypothetical protein
MSTFGDRLRSLVSGQVATVNKRLVDFYVENYKERVHEVKSAGKLEALVINGAPDFSLDKSTDSSRIEAMKMLDDVVEDGLYYEFYEEVRKGKTLGCLRLSW